MEFTPYDEDGPTLDVPYFNEARKEDGWQGHTTNRSYDSLKRDVTNAIAALGGMVNSIQRGQYSIAGLDREGIVIHYTLEGKDGQMVKGRIDVAALPYEEPYNGNKSHSRYKEAAETRKDQTVRMALYNVVEALKAQWALKQLNPSYVPLIPFVLADSESGRTLSQLYLGEGYTRKMLPPGDAGESAIEGQFTVKDDDQKG